MSQRHVHIRVGLFVLSGVGLLILGVTVLGVGRLLQPTVPAETYIDESVQGLKAGSKVRFRGVPLGTVSDISFVTGDYPVAADDPRYARAARLILVRFNLEKGRLGGLIPPGGEAPALVGALVEGGLRVRLASTGLTGVAYLELGFVDPGDSPPIEVWWLPRTLYIPSAASTFTQLKESAQDVIQDLVRAELDELLADVGMLIREGTGLVEDLRSLVGDVRSATGSTRLAAAISDVFAAIADVRKLTASLADEAPAVVESLRGTSDRIEAVAAELQRIGADGNLDGLVGDAREAIANLRRETARLPETVTLANRALKRVDTVVGTAEADVAAMVRNLVVIAENLRQLTANARTYPSQVPFGAPPPPVDYGSWRR